MPGTPVGRIVPEPSNGGAEPVGNWAELAVRWGYYDQSHLIREFREFTGSGATGRSTPNAPPARPSCPPARPRRSTARDDPAQQAAAGRRGLPTQGRVRPLEAQQPGGARGQPSSRRNRPARCRRLGPVRPPITQSRPGRPADRGPRPNRGAGRPDRSNLSRAPEAPMSSRANRWGQPDGAASRSAAVEPGIGGSSSTRHRRLASSTEATPENPAGRRRGEQQLHPGPGHPHKVRADGLAPPPRPPGRRCAPPRRGFTRRAGHPAEDEDHEKPAACVPDQWRRRAPPGGVEAPHTVPV